MILQIKITVYVLFLALVASCSRSVTENAPWNNNLPVPVVFSVISPNEPTRVYLSRTVNSNYPVVKTPYPEATVFITGPDSNRIELTRLKEDTTVFVDRLKQLIVEKGKTYSLKITLADRTVFSQTTVPSSQAIINEATCFSTGTTNNVDVDGKWEPYYVNNLSVKFALPSDTEYGYYLTAFSRMIYASGTMRGNSFQSNYLYSPKDSSSFVLGMTTIDPVFNKYMTAEDINLVQTYQDGNIVVAISQSFGGVLPQYSNIHNGVGLFGSSVTTGKRVEITKPAR